MGKSGRFVMEWSEVLNGAKFGNFLIFVYTLLFAVVAFAYTSGTYSDLLADSGIFAM
jgi:hypothetical protein